MNVEPKELDDQIESMMSCTEKKDRFGITLMMCNLCFKELTKSHLKEHIESNHLEGVSHSCDICGKTARTRHALRQHKRSHKIWNIWCNSSTHDDCCVYSFSQFCTAKMIYVNILSIIFWKYDNIKRGYMALTLRKWGY